MKIRKLRTPDEYYYEKSCKGKVAHKSRRKAKSAKFKTEKRYKIELNIYQCSYCEMFHLGKPTPTINEDRRVWASFVNKDENN